MDPTFAAALARRELRLATGPVPQGRGVQGPDGRMELVGPEHAMRGDSTLCGLPSEEVVVVRHLWRAAGPAACSACRTALG